MRSDMEETYTPGEIIARYNDLPYITPYERIVALVDERAGLVELHEFHGRGRCAGGAAWEVYHYARTSPLVTRARREGARNIFVCGRGRAELELIPGVAGAGLEEVSIEGDVVALTYAGLAGGGIAATLCRGMADGVISTTVHELGGGATLGRATLRVPAAVKLVIGVDDTDDARRGATWSTVNEIAFALEQEGACSYLGHSIVQLFPDNPYKTTNCCSTAIVLGVRPGGAGHVADSFAAGLEAGCFSDECGIAVMEGVETCGELRDFWGAAASRMVTIEEARSAAEAAAVEMRRVTGERGCIGALAALGAHDETDLAVMPAAWLAAAGEVP
jgi:methanogenesis imperfect marker protein 11